MFYAPVTQSGIGAWSATTNYPEPFFGAQCNAYSGYIYCIGDAYLNSAATRSYLLGVTSNVTANEISANGGVVPLNISYDYYAPISASGVGNWKHITPTPLPVDGGSCTISNATIYCIGGSSAEVSIGGISNYSSFSQSYNATPTCPSCLATKLCDLLRQDSAQWTGRQLDLRRALPDAAAK